MEEKQKSMILSQPNFKILEIQEYILVSILTNISKQLSVFSKLHNCFVKTSIHYKTTSEHTLGISLPQAYLMACIYSHMKPHSPKVRGS